MSDKNFKASVEFTLFHETGGRKDGGFTNDPDDHGGETRWGIAKRFNPEVDVRNLTREKAEKIYFEKYWLVSGADKLPWPYCLAVFEAAVNPGIGACRLFVRAAEADPTKSPFTKAMIVCNEREAYYNRQVQRFPVKKKYIRGWLNRVNSVRKKCADPLA